MEQVHFALHDYGPDVRLDDVLIDRVSDPFWDDDTDDGSIIWDEDWSEIKIAPKRLQEIIDEVISEYGGKESEIYFPAPLRSANVKWSMYAREPNIGDYDFVIEAEVAEPVEKNYPTVLSSPTWPNCFDGSFRDSAGQVFRLSPATDRKNFTIKKLVSKSGLDDGYELASEIEFTSEQVKYITLLIDALRETDHLRF